LFIPCFELKFGDVEIGRRRGDRDDNGGEDGESAKLHFSEVECKKLLKTSGVGRKSMVVVVVEMEFREWN